MFEVDLRPKYLWPRTTRWSIKGLLRGPMMITWFSKHVQVREITHEGNRIIGITHCMVFLKNGWNSEPKSIGYSRNTFFYFLLIILNGAVTIFRSVPRQKGHFSVYNSTDQGNRAYPDGSYQKSFYQTDVTPTSVRFWSEVQFSKFQVLLVIKKRERR